MIPGTEWSRWGERLIWMTVALNLKRSLLGYFEVIKKKALAYLWINIHWEFSSPKRPASMSEITKTSRSFWVILPWQTKTSLFSSKMGVLPRENARHRHGREIHGIREGTPVAHLLDLKGFAANKEAPWPGAKKPSWNISRSVLISLISFDVSLCYGMLQGASWHAIPRSFTVTTSVRVRSCLGPWPIFPLHQTRVGLADLFAAIVQGAIPHVILRWRWRCPPGLMMGFMNGIWMGYWWDISGILVE